MRACLVSCRVEIFDDECAGRERGLDLLVVRAAERVEALDFDLDLVMRSSEVMRRHPRTTSAPPEQIPGRAKPRGAHSPLQSHHSNAPIKPVSQSNLSKIIALLTAIMACVRSVQIAFPLAGRLLIGQYQRQERLGYPIIPSRFRWRK
jgi:hypothetical protein